MRTIKDIFAKALFFSCAILVAQCPTSAQGLNAAAYEDVIDNENSLFRVHRSPAELNIDAGAKAFGPDKAPALDPIPPPVALPLKVPGKPNHLERAYLDAFKILVETNTCSAFLGGRHSIAALNQLVKQLRPTYLQRSIAVRMSGPITTYQSHLTGVAFRMFEKADLNLDGPFYRANSPHDPRVPSIGGFAPNTREARVTVLLHELGHLVKGAGKSWLLPDDGDDPIRSRLNTGRILEACERSIKQVAGEHRGRS